MEWLMCLYLLIFLFYSQVNCSSFFSSNSSSTQLCPHDQGFALLQFKNAFSFNKSASLIYWDEFCLHSYPKMLSWEEGTDCCSWDGVTCDRVTGHVIGVDLSCSWLQGTIHSNSSLFLLPHLQWLNLASNDFNCSQISSQFGRFASLMHLNLSYSVFSGHIPLEISHLSKLVSLDLSYNYNKSTGDNLLRLDTPNLKYLVQNLTKLRQLNLSGVNMSRVELGSLKNLSSSLTSLNLRNCELRGKFPANIFCLPNLQKLDLSLNSYLTGYFPKVNWTSPLESLVLSYTSFSGELPDSISSLQSLNHLDLSSTSFLGEVLNSISNLQSLNYLDLNHCNFSGSVPASLGNLTKITHLKLSDNHFIGEIPSSLSNLGQLIYLRLSYNNFSGQLPPSIANLTRLVTLDLSHNQLVGPIPSQVVLPNLNYLNLYFNSLNGTIPSWLFTLPSLVYLDLGYNQLSGHIHEFQYHSLEYVWLDNNELHGPIPSSIFQLVNLTYLTLSSNNLSGIVKLDKFSKLKNLEALVLSYNSLSLTTNNNVNSTMPKLFELGLSSCNLSEFPKLLRTQEILELLDLSNNKIHGQIPKWVWDMGKDSLNTLNLSSNFLTGVVQLPWKNLQILDLHSNLLQGPLPVPPFHTFVFSISNNKLTGDIPSLICNLSSLGILDLSNNSLSGIIPQCLGNFSNQLSVLDLRMNRFHGTIPGMFAKGNSLRNIDLNGNQLEGPVPRSLINCRNLQVLDLGNNKINDTFPYWLETLPELQVLVLRSNIFHAPIRGSKTKRSFPKLRIFDLSNNAFSGPLPTRYIKNLIAMRYAYEDKSGPKYMGNDYYQDSVMVTIKGVEIVMERILTIFTTIDFSNNKFQGGIPKSIGKLCSLRGLNFSHNHLTGYIPLSLENLTKLEALDISSNNISGEIPEQLTCLTSLEFLNLSQNQLVGRIPQGRQFDTFQNDSYYGNWGLCGVPLSKKCSDAEAPQLSSLIFREEDDLVSASGFQWKVVLIGYGCGMVFGLVMGYRIFHTGKPEWLVRIVEGKHHKKVKRTNKSTRRRGDIRN